MKVLKFVFSLCLICGALMSCNKKDKEPNQQTQSNLKEKAKEFATFLTDNYAVGDSIFFRTEADETEGFAVTLNEFRELSETVEIEEDEGEEFPVRLVGYLMLTRMENEKGMFEIRLYVTEPKEGVINIEGGLVINNEIDTNSNYTNVTDDKIVIMISDKACTLQKNVGAVKITKSQKSWTLIH